MAIKRSNWILWVSSVTPTVNSWNWRYVVIWWYMDPNGNIVEETQWVPGSTTTPITTSSNNGGSGMIKWVASWISRQASNIVSPMSTSDVLWARYQAAYNNGNTNLANAYKTLNKENTTYNKVANQIADYYGALADSVAKREQWLADAKYAVANKLFNDMASQKDYVWWLYWPNGSLTKAINTYYDDMGDYLASEAGREMAYADAQWIQSWASIWMMRAQRNQAYNEAFQKSLQVMQAELEAKQAIAQNLITFMTNLRKEYWDTSNDYIISQYERANDLLNTIEENIAKTSATIQAARFGWSGGSSSSSSNEETKSFDDLSNLEKLNFLKEKWVKSNDIDKIERKEDWSIVIHFTDGDRTWSSWDVAKIWWWDTIVNTLGTWAESSSLWSWFNISNNFWSWWNNSTWNNNK